VVSWCWRSARGGELPASGYALSGPSGHEPDITQQLRRTGQLDGHLHAFEAEPIVGESTMAAYRDAEA
jgi:hypothetical protein